MEKVKANERTGHLMVRDHRAPRGATVALPTFEVDIDALFEDRIDLETPPQVGHSKVAWCVGECSNYRIAQQWSATYPDGVDGTSVCDVP